MVFPSVPVFLQDLPNWNQQEPVQQQPQQQQQGIIGAGDVPRQLLQAPQPAAGSAVATGRPTPMAERARLAKITQPEPSPKCPRCDSSNTKFCYFNNYSLSQPRHFCKTCRRYWTRGGALRNVPVGGDCRRNKRSKSASSSKSTTTRNSDRSGGAGQSSSSTSSTATLASSSTAAVASNNIQGLPQFPFMASLQLPEYNHSNISLNFNPAGIQQPFDQNTTIDNNYQQVGIDQQWRSSSLHPIQQFPLILGGLESASAKQQQQPAAGLFPFDNSQFSSQANANKHSRSELISQLASVKMEDNASTLFQLQRQINYLGVSGINDNNQQFWCAGSASGTRAISGGGGGGSGSNTGWSGDLSEFNTSGSGNLL